MKTVKAKLGRMRKEREFVVYPRKTPADPVTVQGDGCIGQFDPATGAGRLSTRGEYFVDLSFRAVPFTFPAEFVKACLEAEPKSGDEIGPGVRFA